MIVHSRVESSHLAGNLLGDPSERDVFVYLPPGYEGSDSALPDRLSPPSVRRSAADDGDARQQMVRAGAPIEDVLEPSSGGWAWHR